MNITTNTNTAIAGFTAGREVLIKVSGTFDSVTAKVQTQDNGTDWVDYPSASFTAAGAKVITMPTDNLRINTAGGGGSLDIDVVIQELKD